MNIFHLIYDIKEKKEIKIFDPFFIKNNGKKSKIVIKNKLSALISRYTVQDSEMKNLKIKLIIYENHGLNMSKMFFGCKSLVKFSKNSQKIYTVNHTVMSATVHFQEGV